jgi:hypothetical protein
MLDIKVEDCKLKLEPLSMDDRIKNIYMWVKQNHINLKQFKVLIYNI